jgi:hypothetical protein
LESLLTKWRSEAPLVRLSVKDRQPSTDNIWRVPVDAKAEINLLTSRGTRNPITSRGSCISRRDAMQSYRDAR